MRTDVIYNGDCIQGLKRLPDNSVDLVVTDPPYNLTQNKWEKDIDFKQLFPDIWRILKEDGVVCIFSQEPFTSKLILSDDNYKYCWYWDKGRPKNHLNAKIQPMRAIEIIVVFYKKSGRYFPILTEKRKQDIRDNGNEYVNKNNGNYGKTKEKSVLNEHRSIPVNMKYPKDIITIQGVGSFGNEKTGHPTQKPEELIKYFVKTYSKENEIVLDLFMGSGTTAKACYELNRRFIGFELDPEYCEIARKRLKQKVITGFFGTQANSTSSSFNKDLTGNSDEFPQILPLAELR